MEVHLLLSTFAIIFVAELPDKTALATVLLATRYRPGAVYAGAAAAFTIQSAVAVSFGAAFGMLPRRPVHIGTAILFLVLAVAMWRRRGGSNGSHASHRAMARQPFARAAWASFLVVFAAEWGDLTQLATAALSARHRSPVTIFTAATTALWTVTGIAIFLGRNVKERVPPVVLRRVAAAAFGVMGLVLLLRS